MEEFVFVDIGEITKEKAEYLYNHYRYLVIAPRLTWDRVRQGLIENKELGGVWFLNRNTLSPQRIDDISKGFDMLRREGFI